MMKSNSMHRARNEMIHEVEKFGIEFDFNNREIFCGDIVECINPYESKQGVKKKIRSIIKRVEGFRENRHRNSLQRLF